MCSQELYQRKKKNHTIVFMFTQINEQHIQFWIPLKKKKATSNPKSHPPDLQIIIISSTTYQLLIFL